MLDKLEEIFKLQKEFQEKYGYFPALDKWASALMSEGGELWTASTDGKGQGKWWKKQADTREHQVEELVDILHFFLGACICLNVSPQELFDAYTKKLGVNYQRQREGY